MRNSTCATVALEMRLLGLLYKVREVPFTCLLKEFENVKLFHEHHFKFHPTLNLNNRTKTFDKAAL